MQTALYYHQPLRELVITPLMLSVLLLTYRDVSAEDVVKQGTALEQQVWTDYVTRMVAEKGNNTRYPLERIYTWLPWLARQMHAHQQTIFYAEYLQTDWLTRNQQQTVTKFATHLPTVILGGCVCLLVSIFVGGFVPNMLGLQYPLLIQLGLVGGFIGGSLNQLQYRLSTQKKRHFRQAVFICVLVAAEGITLYLNPGYFTSDMWQVICILGLGNGLSFWVFQEFLYHMPDKLASRRGHLATWFIAMGTPYIRPAATFGAGLGLSYGLALGLTDSVSAGTMGHPMQSIGPSIGLSIGLSVSVTVVLVHLILVASTGSLQFAERIRWTWRDLLRLEHLRTSLILVGVGFLFFGLRNWLSYELINGMGIALQGYGVTLLVMNNEGDLLSAGLINRLSEALSIGLSYWILLGLYQGMKQEHLEDQDRQQFNQGIRRSLYNGLLIGLISAITITAIGVLSIVLIDGLSNSVENGLSEVWILLFTGMVIMWALSGGLSVLRHYVIRWLLARHHTFPFRASTFLDDATSRILLRRVGGGYSFIHRRLQDYFANAALPSIEEIVRERKEE